jgi:hypothetical protein
VTAAERLEALVGPAIAEAVLDVLREELGAELRPAARHDAPRWLTLEQAASRLGCSPDAVRMRAKRGRLEPRRQGRRLYVSAASVDSLGREA